MDNYSLSCKIKKKDHYKNNNSNENYDNNRLG